MSQDQPRRRPVRHKSQLAALETLVYPPSRLLQENNRLAGFDTLEILPRVVSDHMEDQIGERARPCRTWKKAAISNFRHPAAEVLQMQKEEATAEKNLAGKAIGGATHSA